MEELALLYEAMGTRGFTPREVDELELWECAAVLGQTRPEQPAPAAAADPSLPEFDPVAARIRAHEQGLPPPEPVPPSRVRLKALPPVPGAPSASPPGPVPTLGPPRPPAKGGA